jgi:hypothetical protein
MCKLHHKEIFITTISDIPLTISYINLWQPSKRSKKVNYRKTIRIPALLLLTAMVALLLASTGVTRAASSAQLSPSSCAWKLVSSPSPGTDSNYLAGTAAVSATDVWAVGNYQSKGIVKTLTEHWNGSAWKAVSSPNPSPEAQLNAVSRVPGTKQLWAVGEYFSTYWHTLILKWDGASWHRVASPNVGQHFNFLSGVTAISANDIWAVGSYYDGNTTTTLSEHWNGTKWSIVASANPGSFYNNLLAVAAVSSTNVWAVGNYENGSGEPTLTEHWNGTSWSVVTNPTPGTGGALNAITSVPGTNQLWAVGYYFANTGAQPTLVEHWNGTSWSVVSSPNPGASFDYLQGVTALSANNVWAVGDYSPGEVPIIALAEHWNGATWSVISAPSPDPGDSLYSVTNVPHTSKLWAVGVASSQLNGTLTETYC